MKTSVKQLETDLKNARNDKQNTIPDDAFLSVMTISFVDGGMMDGRMDGKMDIWMARWI